MSDWEPFECDHTYHGGSCKHCGEPYDENTAGLGWMVLSILSFWIGWVGGLAFNPLYGLSFFVGTPLFFVLFMRSQCKAEEKLED